MTVWRNCTDSRPASDCAVNGFRGRLRAEVEALLAEVIGSRYLSRQRRSVAAVYREVVRRCRMRGLPVPARNTLVQRIAQLDPVTVIAARKGRDAARPLSSAGGGLRRSRACWS